MDPDVWYKPETASDGFKYYSYILVYVDDLLIIDKNPAQYMSMVQSNFTVKPGSIEIPKIYLGADMHKVTYEDGSYAWTMSAESFVKKVIANIKKRLKKDLTENLFFISEFYEIWEFIKLFYTVLQNVEQFNES